MLMYTGRTKPEVEHMIGMLVNTLIYRFKISPGVSFTELLTIVKNQCLSSK
jgi:non-ribosomal peptide synthetase component F